MYLLDSVDSLPAILRPGVGAKSCFYNSTCKWRLLSMDIFLSFYSLFSQLFIIFGHFPSQTSFYSSHSFILLNFKCKLPFTDIYFYFPSGITFIINVVIFISIWLAIREAKRRGEENQQTDDDEKKEK